MNQAEEEAARPPGSLEHYLSGGDRGPLRNGWQRMTLRGGEVLWRQEDPANTLVWVERGDLEVLVDGEDVARAGKGELLGEVSIFTPDQRRTAEVRALNATVLWLLPRQALLQLRSRVPAVYDSLLYAAVRTMARRIAREDARIARWARSHDGLRRLAIEPMPDGESARHGLKDNPPPATPALSALPHIEYSLDVVDALGEVARPVYVPPGGILCRQGETASSMYLVAEGGLRVLIDAPSDDGVKNGVIEVGRTGPGAILGAASLLQQGERAASLVAARAAWVYEIDRDGFAALPDRAARALLESLATTLRNQLIRVNRLAMEARGSRGSVVLSEATRLIRGLQAYDAGEATMDIDPACLPNPDPVAPPDRTLGELLGRIRGNVIGGDIAIDTPFGPRRLVYADYTASGRSLRMVEDFISEQVMPMYANTHTEASATGLQTTRLREQARRQVRVGTGADDRDAVLFVGSGATGAINRILDILNIRLPVDLDARYHLSDRIPGDERPVVFISAYEHHSNILPWRHSLADVVMIPLDREGQIDVAALRENLEAYRDRPLIIGSFSAASNVTGIATDTMAITSLLHEYGALSFWDYAAAAPYVPMEMNPLRDGVDPDLISKDAIFLSPHKFIGGPGTPGVLVLKKKLVTGTVPSQPGGGTVDFVTWSDMVYTQDIEHREEAGTPAILESIRCGLAFSLKRQVGAENIHHMETHYVQSALAAWRANPAIRILGNPHAERLSITAFMVRHEEQFLHHNFVVALLNDLFGLQSRGGCSCAGPYGVELLGMTDPVIDRFMARADEGWTSLKPGWTRVNFNYFISAREFRYIVQSVHLVAAYGWAMLPWYHFDPRSGLWRHRDDHSSPRVSMDLFERVVAGENPGGYSTLDESALDDQLDAGRKRLYEAMAGPLPDIAVPDLPAEFEELRWFPMPHEIAARRQSHSH
jgi:selenocysteine lyase/cysteine desulfurase/CRP-like cAMP-binding protein